MSPPRYTLRAMSGGGETHVLHDERGRRAGVVLGLNVMQPATARAHADQGAPAVIVRSGWSADESQPSWMPGPRARAIAGLDAFLAGVPEALVPVLWPRAEDSLSDVPSVLTFLRGRARWRLLLDVAALIPDENDPRAPDLAVRIIDALGGHPALWGAVEPADRGEPPSAWAPELGAWLDQLTPSVARVAAGEPYSAAAEETA